MWKNAFCATDVKHLNQFNVYQVCANYTSFSSHELMSHLGKVPKQNGNYINVVLPHIYIFSAVFKE